MAEHFNVADSSVGGGSGGHRVGDRSANKVVRQSALGSPRHGSTDSRWDNRTVELAYVCHVFHEARLARVRLVNNPMVELPETAFAANLSLCKGDAVYVEWLAGHQNSPVIIGLADRETKERSQSTKRPMSDLVPVSKDDPDAVRHLVERPLLASPNTPKTLMTDVYAKLVNWEAHDSEGRYLQVFAQEMPAPTDPNLKPESKKVPKEFARLYHQFEVLPKENTVYRQIPMSDQKSGWRMSAKTVGADLEVTFECGDYADGVQDWSGNGSPVKLTLGCNGSLKLDVPASVDVTAGGPVTVNADGRVDVNAPQIAFRGGSRPILVSAGGTLPAGVVEVPEVTA